MDYQEFLQKKKVIDTPTGLKDIPKLNAKMKPFQHDITSWALRRGRACIFADCGMGKTLMQLEWARAIPGNVLIFAPLAVAEQTIREGEKFGINGIQYSDDGKPRGKITITNYERIEKFNPEDYNGIVLDECFPKDTLVDTPQGRKYIKDIRRNDKIFNAYGVDYVHEIHKKRINRAVCISTGRGEFTSSENHPFFTRDGWKCAQDIQPGDYIMETATAMRLVREDIFGEIPGTENAKVLQSIMFSELEDETAGNNSEGTYERDTRAQREEDIRMAKRWIAGSNEGNGKNKEFESIFEPGNKEENIIDIAGDEVETFRAWGKWSRDDIASAKDEGCTVRELDTGICYITGKEKTRISNKLQSRLRKSRYENSDRSGRIQPRKPEEFGQKERCYAGFVRVESVEIYEPGDPRMDKYRDENGVIYFYDIKAKRHPSFSINGCLVHNSSIIKSFNGKYRTELIENWTCVPFRLACTATPAPNDFMELGNHAEFVGAMTRTEMLSMFFVHDGGETSKWRLKGHAESEFWEWVCSWAVMIQKPSDLGYDDDGYILPKLTTKQITVQTEKADEGFLFAMEAQTLSERIRARRNSIEDRAQEVAKLVNGSTDQWIVWCNLNSEGDAITSMVDGAVQVSGADTNERKIQAARDFVSGKIRVLVSKVSIFGYGLNLQNCHKAVFFGLSDSYEDYYQAIRRCWRFGQINPVDCFIVTADTEGAVVLNIQRKENDARKMALEMVKNMSSINTKNIRGTERNVTRYNPIVEMKIPSWVFTKEF